jgi:hypothetical protein
MDDTCSAPTASASSTTTTTTTTTDTTSPCTTMDASPSTDVPTAVAVDHGDLTYSHGVILQATTLDDFYLPSSSSPPRPPTSGVNNGVTTSTTKPPVALAVRIDPQAAAADRQQREERRNCAVCCGSFGALAFFAVIIVIIVISGNASRDDTTTTTILYPSFGFFCSSVMAFYALEQPWLKCQCDHTNHFVECQGSRPTEDFNAFTNNTSFESDDTPLSVVLMEYTEYDGGYRGTSCECETPMCEADTTVCLEIGILEDFYHYCSITNNVYGESICNEFIVETDSQGNQDGWYQAVCDICDDDEHDGGGGGMYYAFNRTLECGSSFAASDDVQCTESLIPKPDYLYASMSYAEHTPKPSLLNNLDTFDSFCTYMKYVYEEQQQGGYQCDCFSDDNQNNPFGDIVPFVECRPTTNDDSDSPRFVRWESYYFDQDASAVVSLTYPFLLLGESCVCSEPTCMVSPVTCTALSYDFQSYGCSVYDKIIGGSSSSGNNDTAAAATAEATCGSNKCWVCGPTNGDDGMIRVNADACDGQEAKCRATDFFL